MKYFLRTIIGIVLSALLVLSATAQDDLQDQTILMTFIPNIQFAPMYVAMGGGYFEAEGLNVTLEYLDEPVVVDLVAANENQFGVVSGEQVILAASQQRPIVYVYEWFQQYPIGVVYSADMEVTSFADFAGMRVGIPGRFGANYSGLTTFLETAEMTESDIEVQEIGFNAPEVFCVGAVDAAVIYVNNEPLQIRSRAQQGDCGTITDVNVLPIADVVDLVSNGIITNQQTLEENPELVQAMVNAYNDALELTINNPARAYLLSAPFIEGLPLDEDLQIALELFADQQDTLLESELDMETLYASHDAMYETLLAQFDATTLIQFEVLLASIPLWNAEQLGYSDLASWENMQETLMALGQLEAPVELEAIFTNEFLPASD
jgi:NitT/TauT family transport system substrate-binding protein